jgi:RNA polymerase sigma factor (sigma-70 family)
MQGVSIYRHDPQLIEAALADEPGAWDRLLDAWRPVILRWARRMGGPRIEPHDVLQDVSVLIWTHLHTVRSPEKTFPAWVYRVTQREIMRRRRRAWMRKVFLFEETPERSDDTAGPERRAQMSETSRLVQEVLERLPPAQREVIVLHELEGLNQREVAELLGVALGTVKSRLRLGRARFEQEASELMPPGGGDSGHKGGLILSLTPASHTSELPYLHRAACGGQS